MKSIIKLLYRYLIGDGLLQRLEAERIEHFIRHHEERYHINDKPLYGKSIAEEIEETREKI